ncbi:hypothetical protein ACQPZZ_30955 [Microbispora sp. CA-135349]
MTEAACSVCDQDGGAAAARAVRSRDPPGCRLPRRYFVVTVVAAHL